MSKFLDEKIHFSKFHPKKGNHNFFWMKTASSIFYGENTQRIAML